MRIHCIDDSRRAYEQRAHLAPEIAAEHEEAADQHHIAQQLSLPQVGPKARPEVVHGSIAETSGTQNITSPIRYRTGPTIASGVEELRNRLVGANELNAIAVLAEYADAQRQHASSDHDGDGVLEYAQRVSNTPGTQDGLYWETADDDEASPLAPLKDLVDAVLGERPTGAQLLGYQFRSLHAQGAHGKAGAYDYRVDGHMVGGFAMIAWPPTTATPG